MDDSLHQEAAQVADATLAAHALSASREMTIRCTSVHRTISRSIPIRIVVRVPHVSRGQRATSQARWKNRG